MHVLFRFPSWVAYKYVYHVGGNLPARREEGAVLDRHPGGKLIVPKKERIYLTGSKEAVIQAAGEGVEVVLREDRTGKFRIKYLMKQEVNIKESSKYSSSGWRRRGGVNGNPGR